jgi:hypothetical protein
MSFRTEWWIVKFYLKCSCILLPAASCILLPVSGILKNVDSRNRGRSWDFEIGQSVVRHQSSWNSTIMVTVTVTVTVHTGVKLMTSDRWATGVFWAFDLFFSSHFPSSCNISFSTAACFVSRVAILCRRRLVRLEIQQGLVLSLKIIITDKCVIFVRLCFLLKVYLPPSTNNINMKRLALTTTAIWTVSISNITGCRHKVAAALHASDESGAAGTADIAQSSLCFVQFESTEMRPFPNGMTFLE